MNQANQNKDKPVQSTEQKEQPSKVSQPDPLVPTCDRCLKPFTVCTCEHNKLQK